MTEKQPQTMKKMPDAGCRMLDVRCRTSAQHPASGIQHLLLKFFPSLAVIILMISALTLAAQPLPKDEKQKKSSEKSSRPASVFKLEFTVEETVAGKRAGGRSFTLLLEEDETSRVRMGQKHPIASPEAEPKNLDLGVKFDCKVNERDGQISIEGKLDINDLNLTAEGKPETPPTIRNFQAEFETIIPFDKQTSIGVFEDSSANRRYELRATVTRVK
jgi:hypothetical protein